MSLFVDTSVWSPAFRRDSPTTRELPIYAGRFNMSERKSVAEERVDL